MRHKYETRAIILSRSPLGEANALITLLTPDLGLVRARAQGVRKSGAKLSHALITLAECDIVLVRGKESWRIAGAIPVENWFARLGKASPRARAGRINNLLLRLAAGESRELELFTTVRSFFEALAALPENLHEAAEILAALRILAALGLDDGKLTPEASAFSEPVLDEILKNRTRYIARINNGIAASGL